jgi:glutathione S-transferase
LFCSYSTRDLISSSDQDDDGFVLYESRAIGHYIATKYADQGTPGLIPTELKAFGLFHQACSVEIWDFQEYAGKAHFEIFVKPLLGMPADKAAFDRYVASIEKSLDVYEQILSKQKYIAGDV